MSDVDISAVRRLLRGAGLGVAKKWRSNNIKGGFTTVTSSGIALKRQTEYQRIEDKAERRGYRKAHVPTGKVEVHYLLKAWMPDSHKEAAEQKAADDMALATNVLTQAGYTVVRDDYGVLVVSR